MKISGWFKKRQKPRDIQLAAIEPDQPIMADEVFTPTSSAKRNFIDRGVAQQDISSALKTPGTQIVVFGESGAGKSSLVEHVLKKMSRKLVTTHCTRSTTYAEILASVFDELKVLSLTEVEDGSSVDAEILSALGSDAVLAKLQSTISAGESQNLTHTPIVSPQISAQTAERELAKRQTTWIIEDLHKVEQDVKESVADLLKVFVNRASPRTAVVVLGAVETASTIVQAPAEVRKRVAQIEVKPLTVHELGRILDEGSRLINVDFTQVREEIIRLSSGVASVTHSLALRCLQLMNVETVVAGSSPTVDQVVLGESARSYARSMSGDMKESFDKGIRLIRARRYDNCALILQAIASLPESGGTHAEILAKIRESIPTYPPGNLSSFLPQLAEEDRGELLRRSPDDRWRFNEPLKHTYAQILFSLELAPDDPYSEELATRISDEDRTEAQALAGDLVV